MNRTDRALKWFAIGGSWAAGFMAGMWMSEARAQLPPTLTAEPGTVCASLSWVAPTKNEDGSDLTDLTRYRIYYGLASGEYGIPIPLDNPGLLSFEVCGLTPETTYYFAMTAWNSVGQESEFSEEAPITTGPLTVGEDRTVYTLVQSRDRIALVAVGTAAEDTECDAQSVNGKHLVPVASVTWAGTVRPEVVVAACE